MINFTKWVVKHARITIFIFVVLTLFFGYYNTKIKVNPDITSSLPKHIKAKLLYDKMNKIFPSKDFVLIALESDSLFSPGTINTIFKITDHLKYMPDVYSVMSPTNLKVIRGTENGMDVKAILSSPPETKEEIKEYKNKLFHSDLPIGNIISKDRKMAGIMVFLKNTVKPEDAAGEILTYVQSIKTKDHIYVTGKPILTLYLGHGMARDMRLLFPLTLLLIIIILWFSLRNLRGVLIPLTVVISSVIWTIGLMALVGKPISHSTSMLPILLASIAVADSIHILSHYHLLAWDIKSPKKLVVQVMKELNSPVIITSVTTAFGFLALNTSRIGSIGDLGIFTAIGVMIAMVFSLSIVPAFLSILKIPKRLVKRKEMGLLSKLSVVYANFLIKHSKIVSGVVALIILTAMAGFPFIHLENNTIDNFPKDHPARIDFEHINKHFAAATFLSVLMEGDSSNQIKTPKVLKEMDGLETYLKKFKHVRSTISLADFIKRMNKVMHSDNPLYERIPADTVTEAGFNWIQKNGKWMKEKIKFKTSGRDLIAQYLQLYEMSGKPDDFANLVDYNYRNARISAFINNESSDVLHNLDSKVKEYVKKNVSGIKVELTGTSELFLAINDLVVSGQFYSILASLLLVSLVTTILFRSIKIGLMNTIPLFFAMIFNFGFMGLVGIDLNIVTMLTSSIAIGVGVDYAVHLIYRYRMELASKSINESIVATMTQAGVPIVINALTVGLGFAVLMFSIFRGVQQMGLLIALAMFTSCFGAITILPVIFIRFKPKMLQTKNNN